MSANRAGRCKGLTYGNTSTSLDTFKNLDLLFCGVPAHAAASYLRFTQFDIEVKRVTNQVTSHRHCPMTIEDFDVPFCSVSVGPRSGLTEVDVEVRHVTTHMTLLLT